MQMHYHLQTEDLSPRRERQIRSCHLAREYNTIESFFEMVFSSTSILLFLSLYYVIDARIPEAAFYWQKYQDFFLLLFLTVFRRVKRIPGSRICAAAQDLPGSEGFRACLSPHFTSS